MAFDIIPFGLADGAITVAADGDEVTVGCTPAPKTTSIGATIVVGGTADGSFDLIIETAPNNVGAEGNWQQAISSRLSGQSLTGTYAIQMVDPVIDKVRLRVARDGGSDDMTVQVYWLSDQQPGLTPN